MTSVIIVVIFMAILLLSLGLFCGIRAADRKMVSRNTGERDIWFHVSVLEKVSYAVYVSCMAVMFLLLPSLSFDSEITIEATVWTLSVYGGCFLVAFIIGRWYARRTSDGRRVVIGPGMVIEREMEMNKWQVKKTRAFLVPICVGMGALVKKGMFIEALPLLFVCVLLVDVIFTLKKKLEEYKDRNS